MILRHFWTKTLVFFLFLACTIDLMAAEKFVLFQASPETWQLKNFSVGLSENEHNCCREDGGLNWHSWGQQAN